MTIKNKIIATGIAVSSMVGGAQAQNIASDTISQTKTTQTAKTDMAFAAFNNLYSNALYVKYRTDAGIDLKAPTPDDLAKKIAQDAQKYAQNIANLIKNNSAKAEIKALHKEQMSGVTASKDGRSFSYTYEKEGKPRLVQAELTGSAINFYEQEKEEREFKDFFKVQQEMKFKQHMKNSR